MLFGQQQFEMGNLPWIVLALMPGLSLVANTQSASAQLNNMQSNLNNFSQKRQMKEIECCNLMHQLNQSNQSSIQAHVSQAKQAVELNMSQCYGTGGLANQSPFNATQAITNGTQSGLY